jgi:hypothetical protein
LRNTSEEDCLVELQSYSTQGKASDAAEAVGNNSFLKCEVVSATFA